MTQGNPEHNIYTKEYISEKEFYEIKQLHDLCHEKDVINLKLELDYKLFISNSAKSNTRTTSDTNQVNEFLYYCEDTLISYIGISCFGGNIAELNGMTHPDWRNQGIFHNLFDLAAKECQRRGYSKMLLLSDDNSESGISFIRSVGGVYDFSEYRMKRLRYTIPDEISSVTLREANKQDKKKIAELNNIFFNDEEENEEDDMNGNEEVIDVNQNEVETIAPNTTVFMIECSEEVIGKIHVEYGDNSAFICGFGILPDYRRKGYGKAALSEVLRLIEAKNITEVGLDVVCTNKNALNLYISCGFDQQSIMNYYQFPISTNEDCLEK
jgi:ribosomal protein S18 acetylase RimI-like enzyme